MTNRTKIKDLRYADDVVLIAALTEDLQRSLMQLPPLANIVDPASVARRQGEGQLELKNPSIMSTTSWLHLYRTSLSCQIP